MTQYTVFDSKEEWLASRSNVSASDAGAIAGHNQNSSATKLFLEKTGVKKARFSAKQKMLMERGNLLERKVFDTALNSDDVRFDFLRGKTWIPQAFFGDKSGITATIDFYCEEYDMLVEIKTTSQDWVSIPLYVYDQMTSQAKLSGAKEMYCIYVVLDDEEYDFDASRLVLEAFNLDEEYAERLHSRMLDFKFHIDEQIEIENKFDAFMTCEYQSEVMSESTAFELEIFEAKNRVALLEKKYSDALKKHSFNVSKFVADNGKYENEIGVYTQTQYTSKTSGFSTTKLRARFDADELALCEYDESIKTKIGFTPKYNVI